MSELLRELQEDMQREQYAKLWSRFGRVLIVFCVALVVGTAAKMTYNHWREGKDHQLTHALLAGISNGSARGQALVEQVIAEGPQGLRGIATLHAARSLVEADKQDEAAAKLGAFADSDKSEPYVALSLLHASRIMNTQPNKRLQAGPFSSSARELAAWQALDAGDVKSAVEIFKVLAANEDAPGTLRERAQLVLSYLESNNAVVDATKPKEETDGKK